jgi:hypothetical protein
MKLSGNRNFVVLLRSSVILAVISAVTAFGSGFSERVDHGKTFSLKQLFNVHESPRYWLSVDGRKYYDIKGRPPFCLDVAAIGAVFFVTDDGSEPIAHFILKSGEHIAIEASGSRLGLGIGRSAEASFYDFVDSASDTKVVIASRKPMGSVEKYEFDLQSKTFIKRLAHPPEPTKAR